MPDKDGEGRHDTIGAWTKRCYLAAREAMEDSLRPHGLGATQWYVLYFLVEDGPVRQRELQARLQVERATLSSVVGALVRKKLIEQVPAEDDLRQKLLRITPAGRALWRDLPDLTQIHGFAFDGIDADDLEVAVRVLRTATARLEQHRQEGRGA
ncbi:MarR family transcriptional regulator [Mycolicibacterium neoaurum]|uniref:MarR family winged helix-turn-helix transcriptional regulator n=1 Tax=Mycolicibacterium neoaurum TaxID=1795 RepID=UPI00248CA8B5|nr:MarR family transcriptional regulator [Mycolicibacterium neoaurum]WBP93734.1 MarR family transcriptional regulator [Mycolicibacterium neoaurum]WBS07489.1 MarR family transcriptional regulator [Mycolicibacterium neoaurum]